MIQKPSAILVDGAELLEDKDGDKAGWEWEPLKQGGVLHIHKKNGYNVVILK